MGKAGFAPFKNSRRRPWFITNTVHVSRESSKITSDAVRGTVLTYVTVSQPSFVAKPPSTSWVSEHVPDPAPSACRAGRPPLLVRQLLPSRCHSTSDLRRQELQFLLAVDGDETGVTSAPGALPRRTVAAQVQLAVLIHDEEIFFSAVQRPLQTEERRCRHQTGNCWSYSNNSFSASYNTPFSEMSS